MLADWQMQVSGVMRLDLNTWGFEWTQTKLQFLAAKEDFDMRLKSSITKTKQKLNM